METVYCEEILGGICFLVSFLGVGGLARLSHPLFGELVRLLFPSSTFHKCIVCLLFRFTAYLLIADLSPNHFPLLLDLIFALVFAMRLCESMQYR